MQKSGASHRVQRVEKELVAHVAQYLSAAYKGELPGLVTVTRAQMPSDLRSARVFVSFLNAADEEMEKGLEILQSWAPDIQSYLNDRLPLRYCPRLTFAIDETTEKVLKIEHILMELEKQRHQPR